jgi:hypothetical protein
VGLVVHWIAAVSVAGSCVADTCYFILGWVVHRRLVLLEKGSSVKSGEMCKTVGKQRDLLLLLSLLLVIVVHPFLEHGTLRRLLLGVLTFVPLVLAAMKLSERRGLVWPYVPLISGAVICGAAGTVFSSQSLVAVQWVLATATFALSVSGLFSCLRQHRTV